MTNSSSNPIDPISPNTGGGLTPSQTVGRDEVVAELLERLCTESVRIEDPRRMGKTSVLKLLADQSTDEAPIVYVTVQGHATVDDIVLEIAQGLHSKLRRIQRFKNALTGFFTSAEIDTGLVKFQSAFDNTDAVSKLEQVLSALSDKFPDGRLIIAVDELPWAISNIAVGTESNQGPAPAGAFLQSLQRFRDQYPDIRWVLCGSIGFHHVLRLAGQTNAVLTGLYPISCGPLTVEYANELGRRLLASVSDVPADQAAVEALTTQSGAIPFIAHHIAELVAAEPDVSVASLATAFEKFVHDRNRSAELTHLLQRLDVYMTKEQAQSAEKMLDECALHGSVPFTDLTASIGNDRDAALKILNWLVDDHYLVKDASGFRWRYDVLRRVWVARRPIS